MAALSASLVHDALTNADRSAPTKMSLRQHRRNTKVLLGLTLLAFAYSALLHLLPTLTGSSLLDGIIRVVLGPHIRAHPAANAANMLLFERDALHRAPEWPVVQWPALNLLVFLVGWMLAFLGMTRPAARAA